MDYRTFLKVKIKSLGEEALIIKKEERKSKHLRARLREHRIDIVRYETRHSLLAYGFLRGTPYKQIESKCDQKPDTEKVWRMIARYGKCNQHGVPIGETNNKQEIADYKEMLVKWFVA